MPNSKVTKSFTFRGKRYYVYGHTVEEALEKKAALKRALKEDAITKGGNALVREWYETAFEAYKPNVSWEYMKQMKLRVEKHILSDIGAFPLCAVTPLHCQRIMNRQKGMSKSHIEKLSQELHFIFETARKNGMISKNPADDLVKPEGSYQKRRALTKEERDHLLRVLPSDPRFVFFELMLYCGCRPSEAAGVTYEDVTEIEGVKFLHIRGTKTPNSDRYVPIPKEMYPLLVKTQGSGIVACTQAGSRHNDSSYKRMVDHLKREMNLSMGCTLYRNQLVPPLPLADDFVPYLLRHTYCTDLKKKGVDVRIAKDLMGHSDIKTTANIYDHDDNETLLIAASLIGYPDHLTPKSDEFCKSTTPILKKASNDTAFMEKMYNSCTTSKVVNMGTFGKLRSTDFGKRK